MCNSQLIRWGILFQPRHVFVKNQFPLYPIQSSLEFQKWSKCLPLLLLLSLFLANFRESPARPARHVRFSIIVFFPEEDWVSTVNCRQCPIHLFLGFSYTFSIPFSLRKGICVPRLSHHRNILQNTSFHISDLLLPFLITGLRKLPPRIRCHFLLSRLFSPPK